MLCKVAIVLLGTTLGWAQETHPAPTTRPAASAASRPAQGESTLRSPEQAEILKKLIEQRDTPKPILPQSPKPGASGGERPADSSTLMLEGTMIVGRSGRLLRTNEKLEFEFEPDGTGPVRRMGLAPNQLLEQMEREAERGFVDFVISGEVTRYRGQNYVVLRQLRRPVENGNLRP